MTKTIVRALSSFSSMCFWSPISSIWTSLSDICDSCWILDSSDVMVRNAMRLSDSLGSEDATSAGAPEGGQDWPAGVSLDCDFESLSYVSVNHIEAYVWLGLQPCMPFWSTCNLLRQRTYLWMILVNKPRPEEGGHRSKSESMRKCWSGGWYTESSMSPAMKPATMLWTG